MTEGTIFLIIIGLISGFYIVPKLWTDLQKLRTHKPVLKWEKRKEKEETEKSTNNIVNWALLIVSLLAFVAVIAAIVMGAFHFGILGTTNATLG